MTGKGRYRVALNLPLKKSHCTAEVKLLFRIGIWKYKKPHNNFAAPKTGNNLNQNNHEKINFCIRSDLNR